MSHDDNLNIKIQTKIRNKEWNNPRGFFERRRMNNILKMIPDEGIHHGQIADYMGIDRKSLRPYMKRLQKMGLVTREPGKHGKYFLTKKPHRGTIISADIMAESFKERFLDPLNEKFVLDSPYFKRLIPSSEFELEDALFNFSNLIGGWITYILIHSMNPSNKFTDSEDIVEQNLAVKTFIEDTLSLIQPYLLTFFNFYVSSLLETLHKRIRSLEGGTSDVKNISKVIFRDFLFKRQRAVLDDDIASELGNAFSNVYPNLSRELDKTRLELPALVKREIDEMKRRSERARQRELCKPHEYTQLADDYDDYYVSQCKKCGKRMWKEK
jgi:hypothetical protein